MLAALQLWCHGLSPISFSQPWTTVEPLPPAPGPPVPADRPVPADGAGRTCKRRQQRPPVEQGHGQGCQLGGVVLRWPLPGLGLGQRQDLPLRHGQPRERRHRVHRRRGGQAGGPVGQRPLPGGRSLRSDRLSLRPGQRPAQHTRDGLRRRSELHDRRYHRRRLQVRRRLGRPHDQRLHLLFRCGGSDPLPFRWHLLRCRAGGHFG